MLIHTEKIKNIKRHKHWKQFLLFAIFEVKGVAADIQLKVQLWQMQLDWSRLLTEFLGYLFVAIYHQKSLTKIIYYIISSILSELPY